MFRLPLIDVQRDEPDMNDGAKTAEKFLRTRTIGALSSAVAKRAVGEFDPSAGAGYQTGATLLKTLASAIARRPRLLA